MPSLARLAPFRRWIVYFTLLYTVSVALWLLIELLMRDQWGWLFLISSFGVYYFLPAPLLAVLILMVRHWVMLTALGLIMLQGMLDYGGLFLPRFSTPVVAPTLSILTFNVLGANQSTGATIAAIRTANADIIALQELPPTLAAAIERELSVAYPYRILVPQPGVTGMGVLSRYPLTLQDYSLPGLWVGRPQVIRVAFAGTTVVLVNMHAIPPISTGLPSLTANVRERERQMAALVALTAAGDPTIIVGDLNATERSVAYRIVTTDLRDAWREAGMGFGHTFPGADSPGSSRLRIGPLLVPMWLVRIDYIFHSAHWDTVKASIGPWDGVSDHRPILAHIALRR